MADKLQQHVSLPYKNARRCLGSIEATASFSRTFLALCNTKEVYRLRKPKVAGGQGRRGGGVTMTFI
jgi:hypothetical protein